MAFCDFVVKYDPTKDSREELTKRILYSVFIKRLKAKKPVILFMSGDSGEGKSYSNIALENVLLEIQGLDLRDYFNDINVYTPLEYPRKLENMLHSKRLKKINILCMHEAREIVRAKNWQSFLTQAVADINAMSRTIKRLMIIITSQFIRDITTDIRYTINFYVKVSRPKGKSARLYINVMWKDDRDLEKPRLRKRKLSGYLVYPNKRYRRFVPTYLEVRKPPKDLTDIFDKADRIAKAGIIRNKLNKLMSEMKTELGEENTKVNSMVTFYTANLDALSSIGKRYKGQFKLKSDVRKMHDLTRDEAKQFEEALQLKLKKEGVIA